MGGILLKKHFRAQSENSTFEKKMSQWYLINIILWTQFYHLNDKILTYPYLLEIITYSKSQYVGSTYIRFQYSAFTVFDHKKVEEAFVLSTGYLEVCIIFLVLFNRISMKCIYFVFCDLGKKNLINS